ncbi:MAG: hypothetical protein FWD11_04175 [Micrococcales bacterium]|nr:hypothetical protein [Micrococcales bacterium]
MSYSILVPGEAAPSGTLCQVPGLLWCSEESLAALDKGVEVLVACEGAARGVAVTRTDEGTVVRMFTASSPADVDLAIQAVLALAAAGDGGAVDEEDGDELFSAAEIKQAYGAEFREDYVRWGPAAIVEDIDPDATVCLTGPWVTSTLTEAQLHEAFEQAGGDDHLDEQKLSDAVLAILVAEQDAARPLHTRLDAGDVTGIACSQQGQMVVAAWLGHQYGPTGAERAWRVLGALPADVLATQMLLDQALWLSAQMSPDGDDPVAVQIRDVAVRVAAGNPTYAARLASNALQMAQDGAFGLSLAVFDVVVALPQVTSESATVVSTGSFDERDQVLAAERLAHDEVGLLDFTAQTSRIEQVNLQASWMCNATWAAQADNNKLPVNAARARHYIERAEPYGPVNPPVFFNLACLAFEIGDHLAALRFVSLAKQHGYPRMATIAEEPLLAPLQTHPQWPAALAGTYS